MDDKNITAGGKRTSRRSSTNIGGSLADDTSSVQRDAASNASISSHLHGGSPTSADDQGNSFMGRVRERAAAQLNSQKDRATEGIGTATQAVRQSTQQLREQRHDTIAGYIESAADQLDRFASRLKDKNVSELVDDAQRFARRQPALFIGGAFALGLLGSRFFKSSSPDRQVDRMYGDYRQTGFDRPAYGGTAVGATGTSGTFGTSGPSGGTGTISGTSRDIPGTETF